MDDSRPTQSPTRNSRERPKLGFLGKAAVGLGSLASGLSAGIVYVNKQLFYNVAHGLLATADAQLDAAMTYLGNVTNNAVPGSKEEQFKQFIDSLPAAAPNEQVTRHKQAVRKELCDANTVLGHALKEASETHVGERSIQKVNFHKVSRQNFQEFADKHPEAERSTNLSINQEYVERKLAYDVGTVIDLEAREMLARQTVRHVPWHNKISLSNVQLTKKQKVGAGVVFVSISSIAALCFRRIIQTHLNCTDHQDSTINH